MQFDIDELLQNICEELGIKYNVNKFKSDPNLAYRSMDFTQISKALTGYATCSRGFKEQSEDFAFSGTIHVSWHNTKLAIYNKKFNLCEPASTDKLIEYLKLLAKDVKEDNFCTWCKKFLVDLPQTKVWDLNGDPEPIHTDCVQACWAGRLKYYKIPDWFKPDSINSDMIRSATPSLTWRK